MQCSTLEGRGFIKAAKPPCCQASPTDSLWYVLTGQGVDGAKRVQTVDWRGRGVDHGQEASKTPKTTAIPTTQASVVRGASWERSRWTLPEEEASPAPRRSPTDEPVAPQASRQKTASNPKATRLTAPSKLESSAQLVNLLPVPCQLGSRRKHVDDGRNETRCG